MTAAAVSAKRPSVCAHDGDVWSIGGWSIGECDLANAPRMVSAGFRRRWFRMFGVVRGFGRIFASWRLCVEFDTSPLIPLPVRGTEAEVVARSPCSRAADSAGGAL